MWKNFVNFPGTRLGRLARAKTNEDIIAQCDKYFPQEQTDCGMPEYFFDHSWIGFNSILDVYRYVKFISILIPLDVESQSISILTNVILIFNFM